MEIDEFYGTKLVPTSHMPLIGLLEHASEVYTETHFRGFENKFINATVTIVNQVHEHDVTHGNKYQVIFPDIEHSSHKVKSKVDTITCSCKSFKEF